MIAQPSLHFIHSSVSYSHHLPRILLSSQYLLKDSCSPLHLRTRSPSPRRRSSHSRSRSPRRQSFRSRSRSRSPRRRSPPRYLRRSRSPVRPVSTQLLLLPIALRWSHPAFSLVATPHPVATPHLADFRLLDMLLVLAPAPARAPHLDITGTLPFLRHLPLW